MHLVFSINFPKNLPGTLWVCQTILIQLRTRLCRSISKLKLFAKVISRQQELSQARNFACYFVIYWFYFSKNFPGTLSVCQMVWNQIRTDILLVLIWVQAVCKGYQLISRDTIDVPRPQINDFWVFLMQKIDAECVKWASQAGTSVYVKAVLANVHKCLKPFF